MVERFSLISPNRELARKINEGVKFGYIMAQNTSVHPNGELKSFVAVDFERFYARILQHSIILLNSPMVFQKNDNLLIKTSKTLGHNVFSNLFFSALEHICSGRFQFGLTSKEFRCSGVPQDCVIEIPSPSSGE